MTINETTTDWDLTLSISPYLDRHMMFPLLEYLDTLIQAGKIEYSAKDVAAARLSLLRPTHMVDYAIDIYKNLNGTDIAPEEMLQQKEKVYQRLEELRAGCKSLYDLCQNTQERAKLTASGQWNVASLVENSSLHISQETIETFRLLAKYNYECGDYQTARDELQNYISLFSKPPPPTKDEDDEFALESSSIATPKNKQSSDTYGNPNMYHLETVDEKMLQVLWGMLACQILVEDWKAASVAMEAVQTALELLVQNKDLSPLQALEERTWLLHWSLFVYWNEPKTGLEQLVDLFFSEKYRQAITTHAPHLLRYLTAAVLLIKRGKNSDGRRLLKNLGHVMQNVEYTDAICEFVNCLSHKFDFEMAQQKLQECEHVLERDFFLCKQTAVFMEEARVFVFENYCRIHDKIDLGVLGEKLAMPPDQAERWIVDLIRNADLDAKIDSEHNCVVMRGTSQSIYEQVMERTDAILEYGKCDPGTKLANRLE
jgi:translation initiation factor 3 subunit E